MPSDISSRGHKQHDLRSILQIIFRTAILSAKIRKFGSAVSEPERSCVGNLCDEKIRSRRTKDMFYLALLDIITRVTKL